MRSRGKKQALVRNGTRLVTVCTRHGQFELCEQQYLTQEHQSTSFLRRTGQALLSRGLEEFCLRWSTLTSSRNVVALTQEICGRKLASAQTILTWALRKAQQIDARLCQEVEVASAFCDPPLCDSVDLYDPNAEEVHVFCDGIVVKAQKPTHQKRGEPKEPKIEKQHETEVVLFQKPEGGFRYLMPATDGSVGVACLMRAFLRRHWHERATPLPVVAITDGATKIRAHLSEVFGSRVSIILDWYHLQKKTSELLSMVAHSRSEREALEQQLHGLLWQGRVGEGLALVKSLRPRNEKMHAKLISYLERHASEIIDYARRQAIGKKIGSGRMEKAVDQAVGIRQKDNGMSWSKAGSRTLAQLTIAQLNGEWNELWPSMEAAA